MMVPILKRIILLLIMFLTYLTSLGVRAADCRHTGAIANMSSSQSLDLSTVFQNSTIYSTTLTTNFSQTLACTGKALDTIKFYTQGSTPYYVNFTDESASSDYWVKITTEISPASKKMNSPASLTTRSMSDYQAVITLTAELVSAPSGTLTYTKKTTSGAALIPVAAAALSATTQEDYYIMAARDNFYDIYVYAVQRLNISYTPHVMSCEVRDQTVRLPTTGINELLSGQSSGLTEFTLPIYCDSETGITNSNVNVWLMSNNIVDSANKVLRNEESSSAGIGISLQDESGGDVIFSSTNTLTDSVTKIKTISKGDSVEDGAQNITLNAYYKIYDQANVHAGSVNATATVMFSYD